METSNKWKVEKSKKNCEICNWIYGNQNDDNQIYCEPNLLALSYKLRR